MGFKSIFARPLASFIEGRISKMASNAVSRQKQWLHKLLQDAQETSFGQDHEFASIKSYEDFKANVPIRDYEALKSYVNRVVDGELNVLWPGKPEYFAKTSGTTSGVKYIPITKESIPFHIKTARDTLLCYMKRSGNYSFADGNMIFLSGSPEMTKTAGIWTGRLSGIVNHHVPGYLRSNQLPSYETNCIEDWEEKVDQIVAETIDRKMSLISGIPPWVQMYLDKLESKSGKKIGELFPKLSVFAHGGVNYEPYRLQLEKSFGRPIDTIETYPASEGFIAFQDQVNSDELLLNADAGIFFEFIPMTSFHDEKPQRLALWEVEEDVNYALVMSTNAGLWAYMIGDTVRFVSTDPYRLKVTGRVSQYISAFGEHVIIEEVEHAMQDALESTGLSVKEFTVAPRINVEKGLPYHEWLVEFRDNPSEFDKFAKALDDSLCSQNVYYKDLIEGAVLEPAHIVRLEEGAFHEYLKSEGKLGGQNKVPRLRNDRDVADGLIKWQMK